MRVATVLPKGVQFLTWFGVGCGGVVLPRFFCASAKIRIDKSKKTPTTPNQQKRSNNES